MRNYLIFLSLVLAVTILITGCGQQDTSSGSSTNYENEVEAESTPESNGNRNVDGNTNVEWPELLVFATANQGSTTHVSATIIADMLKRETPIRQVVVEPYGSAANMVRPLDEGEVHFAFHGSYREFTDAYYGEGSWKEEGPKNVKSLMLSYIDPWGIYVTDPELKEFSDLKGKRFVLFTRNTDHLNAFNALLDIYDMTEDDLNVIPAQDIPSAIRLLADGRADAFMFALVPSLQEVKQAHGLWAIPIPEDVATQVIEKEPTRLPYTVKAGETLIEPEEDFPFLGLPGGVAVNGDLDEELVYEISKLIYEHSREQLYEAKPDSPTNWKPEHATDMFTYPFHEGFIKYLKEEGYWSEELEKQQQELEE